MTQPAATADPAVTSTTAPVPTAPVATPAAPADPAVAAAATPDLAAELASVKAEAEKWKSFSRRHEDNAKATTTQLERQQAILAQLAEKAGVQLDGAPDPAKIAAQLEAAQQAAKQRALELAVFRSAASAGGNADALLDSRAFMAKASELDANDPDLAAKVKAMVDDAVKANPNLAAAASVSQGQQQSQQPPAPIPATSGANFSGAPAGGRGWTMEDVQRSSPEAVTKAMNEGLLAHLGFGPGKHR